MGGGVPSAFFMKETSMDQTRLNLLKFGDPKIRMLHLTRFAFFLTFALFRFLLGLVGAGFVIVLVQFNFIATGGTS